MLTVPDNKENIDKCVCTQCPTHLADDCAQKNNETLYCAEGRGKSACDLLDRGCLCGSCPLWDEYELKDGYFCMF